ncbi:MFS transporter [Akkermansiaceae bacterium]|nr:MFS transporter [Akkermansiaceae bacterium]MDB4541291.1 MFS transporter [Akkermansiaceae bacterium]
MSNRLNFSDLDSTERGNSRLIVIGQTFSKLGDILCNAKTVLTWLMGVVGAPPALTALLVPIRESGSMLPQAFISGFVKRAQKRKKIFVLGAIGQAICLVVMGLVALFLKGATAGWAIVISLTLLSLARCLCSISSKDLLGKTIPKGIRGRISGIAATISGLIGLGAALWTIFGVDQTASQVTYAWIIFTGSLFYLMTAVSFGSVSEENSPKASQKLGGDLKKRLHLVWTDPVLRRFVIARTLLLGSALASPYLVILSQQKGFDLRSLASFVMAGGLASALSSFLWGSLSDRSSRKAMVIGGVIAGIIGLIGVFITTQIPTLAESLWTWPALFFLLNIGYAGVRIGRKTYIVDISGDEKRTDYVSASNSVIAVMVLILGAAGSALQLVGATTALTFFSVICLLGSIYVIRLQKIEGLE